MAKGSAPVNVKGEKEKFIKALKEESKQFDLETIKNDLNKKIDQIAVGIKKEEKKVIVTEEKQLRNLDKLTYMAEYLEEDNQKTTQSLQQAQQIKDESKQQMKDAQTSNSNEIKELQ